MTSLSITDSALMRSITLDEFYLYEHDVIWNRDSLLCLMPSTIGRVWEIQDFDFTTSGDIAHFSYYNQSMVPANRSWHESGLMIRTEDGLKLKFMHSTKLYLSN